MALTPGTRLGPYEVVAPLGAGGMGEVYRARDTRLGRDVAVKVLPQHLASSPELRARFEREAKTISGLNHPNICTLHDVGREGAIDYLVMELIEGETLATRLRKGPLPIAETLRIGSAIADALDRAHRASVVHRDLKPGNIMLTKAGAKLMDFGLARVSGLAGPGQGSGLTFATLTQSPGIGQPLTAEGTLVGTFQYMSPEQLEGKESDARSDLWAFGCVLYEMATGRPAFAARSQASLIGAIMHAEPAPVSQVAPMSPPELDRIVRACLVKDPDDRVQSAHDLKLQLAWLADGASSSSSVAAPRPKLAPRRPGWLAYAIVALAAAGLTALGMLTLRGRTSNPDAAKSPQRYVLGRAALTPSSAPALSPDGSYVVFSTLQTGVRRLVRRELSSLEATPIAGTEDGSAPFFSPDGAWIGFATASALKKVPAAGGTPQTILSESRINSADWGEDGVIVFTQSEGGGGITALSRVSATGGRAEIVAVLDTSVRESEAWLPEILPGGQNVLISITGGVPAWRVVGIRPDGTRVPVLDNAILTRYVASGHLLYTDLTSEAVLAAPFDPERMQFTGPAVPLTDPIDADYCFDVHANQTLIYVPTAGADVGSQLVWLTREGVASDVMETRDAWTQPRISPDGTRILLRRTGISCELWMYDIERASLARIAQGSDNHDPIWAPDGRSIVYEVSSAGGQMVTMTVEGAREVRPAVPTSDRGSPQSWSAGGNLLVFTQPGRGTGTDIWICAMDGARKPAPFLMTEFDEKDPAISADGKWIAYVSNESGSSEVFVRPYPPTGDAWRVSMGGGASPLWSRDGRELYFTSATKMMAAPVSTRPTLAIGKPIELFDGGFNGNRARDFDVAADGRFVAINVPGGNAGQRELRVLLDWPLEVARVAGPAH